MKRARQSFLVRLYPRAWRERYGGELADLLEDEDKGPLATLDVLRAASGEWVFGHTGLGRAKMQMDVSKVAKRGALLCASLIVLGAIGVWATAKPYQQDRILIELGLKER